MYFVCTVLQCKKKKKVEIITKHNFSIEYLRIVVWYAKPDYFYFKRFVCM